VTLFDEAAAGPVAGPKRNLVAVRLTVIGCSGSFPGPEATYHGGPQLPPDDSHLTARQAAEHSTRAGAARLVLTHLQPWNDKARALEEAGAVPFGGEISLAASGKSFGIG